MNSQLNQSQTQALSNRLYSRDHHQVAGIWGPPGTGKTFVAGTEATCAVIELDQRVLVCAFQPAHFPTHSSPFSAPGLTHTTCE